MKYSLVNCGECGEESYYIVCEWPPSFFWCRYCHKVFSFEKVESNDGVTWQLRGFPTS